MYNKKGRDTSEFFHYKKTNEDRGHGRANYNNLLYL